MTAALQRPSPVAVPHRLVIESPAPVVASRDARHTLQWLQVVRGAAALWVAFYHMGMTLLGPYGRAALDLPAALWLGYAGVDIFFCLSGFIIYHAHARDIGRRERIRPFAVRRVVRVYPIYWVVTLAVVALTPWFPRLVDGGMPAAGWLAKSLLLLPQGVEPVLTPAWSLIHEMRFYAFFAALLFLPRRAFMPALAVFGVGAVALLHVSIAAPAVLATLPGRGLLFLFHPTTAEFVLGVLAGMVYQGARTGARTDAGVLAAGVATMAVAVLLHDVVAPDIRYHAVATFAIPSFLLVLGLVLVERRWPVRAPGAMTRLGDASYSLYLLHWPVMRLVAPWVVPTAALVWPGGLLLVLVATVASLALYALVERPVLRWLRRVTEGERRPAPAEAGAVAGAAA